MGKQEGPFAQVEDFVKEIPYLHKWGSKPQSLLAKVLKCSYFESGSILTVEGGFCAGGCESNKRNSSY